MLECDDFTSKLFTRLFTFIGALFVITIYKVYN